MCQVHTGAYVSLLAPGKTTYTACHARKTTTYILHVVPITTHTHVRRKSIGNKKQEKETKRKERKGKERTRNARKSKKRQDKKRKQEKEKRKNVILADPRKLTKDGIGLIEGIKCINGTGGKTQQGEKVRAALR